MWNITSVVRKGFYMEQVLLLNSDEEPLHLTSWRRALVLLLKGKAECVEKIENIENYIKIDNTLIPKVIILKDYRAIPHTELPYSRENIFKRDEYTCQYCGKHLPGNELTLDHVYPKSRLGPDTWENIVACCKECNQYKADRTPKEAGMKLLRRPSRPLDGKLFELTKNSSKNIEYWIKYYKTA